jgi:hypothetical protein
MSGMITTSIAALARVMAPSLGRQAHALELAARKQEAAMRGLFLRAVAAAKKMIPLEKPSPLDYANAVQVLMQELSGGKIADEWRAAAGPQSVATIIEKSQEAGAKVAANALSISFDGANPRAIAWAKKHSAKLVTNIGSDAKKAIRVLVVKGFSASVPTRTTASLIRSTIGLTERQAEAVMNRQLKMLADGLTQKAALAHAEKYAAKSLRDRANLIAYQENMTAAAQGQRELWQQGIDAGQIAKSVKKTLVQTDPCPVCWPMEGEVVGINEQFSGGLPPFHVRCKCVEGITGDVDSRPGVGITGPRGPNVSDPNDGIFASIAKNSAATPEQIAKAWEMYSAGIPYKQIAEVTGLNPKQAATIIFKIKKKGGLPPGIGGGIRVAPPIPVPPVVPPVPPVAPPVPPPVAPPVPVPPVVVVAPPVRHRVFVKGEWMWSDDARAVVTTKLPKVPKPPTELKFRNVHDPRQPLDQYGLSQFKNNSLHLQATFKADYENMVKQFPFLAKKTGPKSILISSGEFVPRSIAKRYERALGLYEPSKKRLTVAIRGRVAHIDQITIGQWSSAKTSALSTFRHELGHYVHMNAISPQKRQAWTTIWNSHKATASRTVSQYSATNEWELFAESWRAYTTPGYRPGTLPVAIENFFITLKGLK